MTPNGRRWRYSRSMPCLLVLLVLCVPIGLAGCRGGSGRSPSVETSTAAASDALGDAPGDVVTDATPSAAADAAIDISSRPPCAAPKPHASGDVAITLRSVGADRTALVHVPPSYDGTRATPFVLNLHGFRSNGRQQARYSGFPAKADAEGFIVASPDGTGTPLHWSYPGLGGVDDVAFIRDLLDRLEADLCIDAGRVFIAGISNGAAFAQIVACAMPDRITAVAAVAALVYPPRCATQAAIAVIGFHGTDDPCVPFGGGTSACGQKLPVPPVEGSAKNWASHDVVTSLRPSSDSARTSARSPTDGARTNRRLCCS